MAKRTIDTRTPAEKAAARGYKSWTQIKEENRQAMIANLSRYTDAELVTRAIAHESEFGHLGGNHYRDEVQRRQAVSA